MSQQNYAVFALFFLASGLSPLYRAWHMMHAQQGLGKSREMCMPAAQDVIQTRVLCRLVGSKTTPKGSLAASGGVSGAY